MNRSHVYRGGISSFKASLYNTVSVNARVWGGPPLALTSTPPGPAAPSSINLSNQSVAESSTIGTTIGTLSASGSATITYSIVSDPSSKFSISGTALQTSATLDFETATSHSVTVRATNGSGFADQVFTVSVTNVVEVPVSTVVPSISGTTTEGQVLTGTTGTFTSAAGGMTYTYVWKRAGAAISGATSSTYTLVTADVGTVITLSVTATNSDGSTTATSAGTAAIAAIGGSNTATATAPTGVTAGFTPFVSGTTDASQVYVELYSVTDSAVVGSRVAATMGSGYWSTGNVPATSSISKTYNHRVYTAASGGTALATSSNWTTAVWAGKPGTTRLQIADNFNSPTAASDRSALLAQHTALTVPRLTAVPVASGSTSVPVSGATSNGASPSVISVTCTGTVPAVGDFIKVTGATGADATNINITAIVKTVVGSVITYGAAAGTTAGAVPGTLTVVKPTGSVRVVSLKLAAIASPGASIWYDGRSCNAYSVKVETSSTSADGNTASDWADQGFTPWAPPTYTGGLSSGPTNAANLRGQMIGLSPVAAGMWVKFTFTNYDLTNTLLLNMAAIQHRSDGLDDIGLELGMSITVQDDDPLIMRKRVQSIDPTRDPFFVNLGHPGGKLSDMLSNLNGWIAAYPKALYGYALLDAGPNDSGSSNARLYTNTGNPPTAANGTNAAISTINTNFQACVLSLASRNGALSSGSYKRVFAANIGHSDFAAASPATAVNDLAATSQGNEPYNWFVVDPLLKTGTNMVATWYPKLGVAQMDCQTAFQVDAPNWFFLDLTTHPGGAGQVRHHKMSDPMQAYLSFGNAGQTEYEKHVSAIATAGAPSWYKTRLTTIAGLLSPTSNLPTAEAAVANNERAVIAASLLAAPTTFTQKTGTKPTDLSTQPLAWYQFHDWSTLTFDSSNRITAIADKGPNGYNLSQATTSAMPPYVPGAWPGGRSVVRTNANASRLGGAGAPAGLKSAMDAAAQPFMFFWKSASFGVGNNGSIFGWGAAGAQTLQCQTTGADELGLSANAQWRIVIAGAARLSEANASPNLPYVPIVMSALYDGTTLYLRRNGVQTASVAYAKPAHTGDTFTLLANGPGTSLYSGEVGEMVFRADYNITDAASIETWLAVQ